MRIWDYIKQTTIADIATALQNNWPDMPNVDVAAHIDVVKQLWDIKPADPGGMYIEIHWVEADSLNDTPYWSVSGKYPKGSPQNEEWDGYWALDLAPWAEIKAMQIRVLIPEGKACLSAAEVVALILWEMTFYGFNPGEVKEVSDRLDDIVGTLDDISLDDCISHEDFLKMLDDEDDDLSVAV